MSDLQSPSRSLRVLWIPFTPWSSSGWDGSRHFHLLRQLKGHEIHVLAWNRFGAQSPSRVLPEGVTLHPAQVLPRYWSLWNKEYPRRLDTWANEVLLGFQLRRVTKSIQPDLLVLSSTHYATGFIPLPANVPVLLDHIDEMPPWVASMYFEKASAVAAVSPSLRDHSIAHGKRTELIENGVDVSRYSSEKRDAAKSQLGLEGKVVVSLIGLTCSKRLYFLDSFEQFSKIVPNAVLLLVGECRFQDEVKAKSADIRILGHIPYDEVSVYFNATDVGLYPCDDTPYFREAHPLKIVEYSAAGCQVVSSPVNAFQEGWPNVRTSVPETAEFADAMITSLRHPRSAPDVTSQGWTAKAAAFEKLMFETVQIGRR